MLKQFYKVQHYINCFKIVYHFYWLLHLINLKLHQQNLKPGNKILDKFPEVVNESRCSTVLHLKTPVATSFRVKLGVCASWMSRFLWLTWEFYSRGLAEGTWLLVREKTISPTCSNNIGLLPPTKPNADIFFLMILISYLYAFQTKNIHLKSNKYFYKEKKCTVVVHHSCFKMRSGVDIRAAPSSLCVRSLMTILYANVH